MAKVKDVVLAQSLNALRLSQNMSFEELASKCGLGVATLKRMLNKGEFGELDALVRVFTALGLGDTLMQTIRGCVPDVTESPYYNADRQRASKKMKPAPSSQALWPEQ